ncbi:MAG: hypothetical protein OXG39_09740 [Chloroflexi bacterium]|nr:hypothetical protein [Chloroflexota bacterium]
MLEPAHIFPPVSDAAPLVYDPAVHLVANTIDNGVFHSAWMSAEYAVALVERASPAEIERAEAVINAVLDCQDTDTRSPHYGNFKWEHEDEAVEDLNAVQFVLVRLIPLLLNHAERLSTELVERVKARIQLGLDEIRRIDVSPKYSNIVAQDIANSLLGGQLLNLPEYAQRGAKKLRDWLSMIDESGIPHEYNSPTYSFVCIEALHKIVAFSEQSQARLLAQLIISRIGLSVALRLHPETGRLAPPHCRAYYPALVCRTAAEVTAFARMIEEGKLPAWLEAVRQRRPIPLEVSETSDAGASVVISSYLHSEFSLGLATQELATQSNRFISNQSNVFSIQYTRQKPSPGVVFSRYLINDKWLGDYRTTPSRSNDQVFRDEGSFRGVLAGPRAFGLYTSRELDAWSRCSSAKAVLIWSSAEDVDEIWIDGTSLGDLPANVPEGAAIVVGCGDVYILIRPLARAKLGVEAPIIIAERRGCLALEMYNYRGPDKTFWELANPGAFFQGYVHNGFFVEVAAKDQCGSAKDLYETFAAGQLSEELEDARTFDGVSPRQWSLAYSRDDLALGIDVDLMRWRIQRRWAGGAKLGCPMLDSPVARESRSGLIELGNARLACGRDAAWLVAIPEADLWVGAFHGPEAAALTLDIAENQVHLETLQAGMVLWDKGHVTIDALGLQAEPHVVGAKALHVIRRDEG